MSDAISRITGDSPPEISEGICLHKGCNAPAPRLRFGGFEIKGLCPEHLSEAEQEAAEREQRALARQLFERAGGNALMADWSFATYPDDDHGKAACHAARKWMAETPWQPGGSGRNLILTGDVGTGKTGLAWAIVRELCEQGVPARLVNVRDLMSDLRDEVRHQDRRDLMAPLRRTRVLVLDDLGGERVTDFVLDEIARLVDHRYGARLPTIVTTNFRPSKLSNRLGPEDPVTGERIISRLVDGADMHKVGGADRRGAFSRT